MIVGSEDVLNPTLWLGSFEWREPVTTLTDFLVAMVAWYALFKFHSTPKENRNPKTFKWFRNYFLAFAIGMTSAAWLGHGLQAYVTPRFKIIGWVCGATGLLMLQMGSLQLIRCKLSNLLTKILSSLFVLEWIVALFLMINPSTSQFMVTQINSVIALILLVLPMHLISWKGVNRKHSRGVIIALIYSAIPGLVYSNQVSFGIWFNYHDISHVLMSIFMFLMFRALIGLSRLSPNA